ncbi:MAG: hypothetical protein J6S67_00060 [Methanobrevibacter sp.]|nr:hypothetical protein [Methanobrevibacter sp.]
MEDEVFETESGYTTGSGIDSDTVVDTSEEHQEVFAISEEQFTAALLSAYEQGALETKSGLEEIQHVNDYDTNSGVFAIRDSIYNIEQTLNTMSGQTVQQHNLQTAINDYYLSEYLMLIIIIGLFGYMAIKSIINNVFHL